MAPPRSAGLGPESESESLSAGPVSFGDVDAVVLVPSSLVVGVVSWLDDVVVAAEVSVNCVDWTDFVAARIVVRTEGSSHSQQQESTGLDNMDLPEKVRALDSSLQTLAFWLLGQKNRSVYP